MLLWVTINVTACQHTTRMYTTFLVENLTTVRASRCLYCYCMTMRLTLVGLPWHWCSGVPAGPGPPSSCLTVEHSQLVIHAICAHLLLFTSQVAEDSVYWWHLNDKLHMIKVWIRIGWSAASARLCSCGQNTCSYTHNANIIIIINMYRKMFLAKRTNEQRAPSKPSVCLADHIRSNVCPTLWIAVHLIRLNGWMPFSFSSSAWEKKSFHVAN